MKLDINRDARFKADGVWWKVTKPYARLVGGGEVSLAVAVSGRNRGEVRGFTEAELQPCFPKLPVPDGATLPVPDPKPPVPMDMATAIALGHIKITHTPEDLGPLPWPWPWPKAQRRMLPYPPLEEAEIVTAPPPPTPPANRQTGGVSMAEKESAPTVVEFDATGNSWAPRPPSFFLPAGPVAAARQRRQGAWRGVGAAVVLAVGVLGCAQTGNVVGGLLVVSMASLVAKRVLR